MKWIAAAWGADFLTFALVVPIVGIGAESNPVMVRAYLVFGLLAVLALKLACLVVVLSLATRIRRWRPGLVFVGIVPVIGAVGNVAALLR